MMPASRVFKKFKAGKLHSGSKHGPTVQSRDQAIAIYMSEKEDERSGKHEARERPKRTKR